MGGRRTPCHLTNPNGWGWHFLLCSHGTPVTGVEVVYTAQPPALYEYGRRSIQGSGPQWLSTERPFLWLVLWWVTATGRPI